MSTFSINPPDFNGEIEVGLAVGTVVSLPEDLKLNVVMKASVQEAAGYAGAWAMNKFASHGTAVRDMMTSAAIGVVMCGLTTKIGGLPDDDWRELASVPKESLPVPPESTFSKQAITAALTVGVASKVMVLTL